MRLPLRGRILLSVKESDKRPIVSEARTLSALGYQLLGTGGTWRTIRAAGVPIEHINKLHEGRPHIVDAPPARPNHAVTASDEGLRP